MYRIQYIALQEGILCLEFPLKPSGSCVAASGAGSLVSIGFDDNLRTIDVSGRQYAGAAVSLSAQPRALEVKGELTFVATLQVF
jgi:hypothetical protein